MSGLQLALDAPGVTSSGQGEAYWFFGHLAVVRSPEGARPIVIEHHVGPDSGPPLHVHPHLEDSFYLVSGQLAVRCGDDSFLASEGDYVALPAGVPHAFRVVSDEEAVLLQTHARTDFLDFIRRGGVPADQRRPETSELDFTALHELAAETGQPVLGPPLSPEDAAAILAAARPGRRS